MVKPFSPRELVFRVKVVLKRFEKGDLGGERPLSFNGGSLVVNGDTYKVMKAGKEVRLTPTEFKVLFTLASSPHRVFTRSELVEKALGYQFVATREVWMPTSRTSATSWKTICRTRCSFIRFMV